MAKLWWDREIKLNPKGLGSKYLHLKRLKLKFTIRN